MFICVMYSGGIPLMYFGCTIFLTLIYWVTKIMILKYNQKSLDYNHSHIINSYNLFKYGILAHLIMSLMFFMNSKAFSVGDKIKVDFLNNFRLNKLVSEGALKSVFNRKTLQIRLYISLIIIVGILYVFNLVVINPVTCFAREGCCFVKNKEKQISKNQRNKRAKRHLAANNN